MREVKACQSEHIPPARVVERVGEGTAERVGPVEDPVRGLAHRVRQTVPRRTVPQRVQTRSCNVPHPHCHTHLKYSARKTSSARVKIKKQFFPEMTPS